MIALLLIVLSLGLAIFAELAGAWSVHVGLALRSDSIVLVQLGDQKTINYTIRRGVDQEYQDFMAGARDEVMYAPFLKEHLQGFRIYGLQTTETLARGYTTTSFPCAHIVARNIRPVIEQARSDLGSALVCDALVFPSYQSFYGPVTFFKLAAALAGCGRIDLAHISGLNGVLVSPELYNTIDLSKREDCRKLWSGECFTGLCVDRFSFLVEIEPSHIRFDVVVIKPGYGWLLDNCGHTCDRRGLSVTDSLLDCITSFKQDRRLYDEVYDFLTRAGRRKIRVVKSVFISGSLDSQEEQVKAIIGQHFGDYLLEEMGSHVSPELLGAYGGACLARRSRELGRLPWANISNNYFYRCDEYGGTCEEHYLGLDSVGTIEYPANW